MKSLHWLIFAIAFWFTLSPFVADKILIAVTNAEQTGDLAGSIVNFLQASNLIFGLALIVLTLIAISTDAVVAKTDAARSMHWIAVGIGIWLVVAPFALDFTLENFSWNNLMLGIMVGVFTLVQLNVDKH